MNLLNIWQNLKHETASLMKKIELLEASKRFNILNFYSSSQTVYKYIHHNNKKKKLYVYYSSFRKLMGEGLGSCSLDELQQIEQQLEKSVSVVRARKVRVSQTC